jgi:hypothetical protein
LSDGIRVAVSHSATLLVIHSESYLTSEWCQQELALFLQAAAQTGGATGRIFLVRVDALDYNCWPEAFHGLLGQRFFEQANNDAPARTLGTPLANDQQFPLMTFGSYTTYVGGRLSEHFDHPFLSFEATCTIRTDTIPGGKQVHFAVQA